MPQLTLNLPDELSPALAASGPDLERDREGRAVSEQLIRERR